MVQITPDVSLVNASSQNQVGCCSRYRECSDAGRCLIPESDIARSCQYRRNLEAGKIFYGKRSDSFDEALYRQYQRLLDLLDDKQKKSLFAVLHVFFDLRRGATEILFYADGVYPLLEKSGFFRARPVAAMVHIVAPRCNMKSLKQACGDRLSEAKAWAMTTREARGKESSTKPIFRDELVEWVTHHDQAAGERLCSGLTLLSLPPFPSSFTLEEFFLDNRVGDCALRLPDDDPRFLKHRSKKREKKEVAVMPVFNGWDDSIMDEVAQVKRRLSGEKLKAEDVQTDFSSRSAEIQGSAPAPYHADLSGCTCPDFAINNKPCKHMYRLALELGILKEIQVPKKKVEKPVVESFMQSWKQEYLDGHISPDRYVRVMEALEK